MVPYEGYTVHDMEENMSTREVDGRTVPTPGTWVFEPTHTKIEAVARHLMVTRVRGHFIDYEGSIEIAEDPTESTVELTFETKSIATGVDDRDNHLRSADFMDADNYPTITFTSTSVEPADGDTWALTGDLTIRGMTKPIAIQVTFLGVVADPFGQHKAAFSGSGEFDRRQYGLTWNVPLDGGGLLVSEKFRLEIEAQLVRAS